MSAAVWAAYQAILALIGIPRWAPALVLAGGIGMVGAYFYGHHQAALACQEASLRTQIATMERDNEVRNVADQVEAMLNKGLETDNQQLAEKVKSYEVELRNRPAQPDCSLTDDDLRGLGGVPDKRKRKGTGG